MRVDLFDFELPADHIALRPVSPRDAARLLIVRPDDAAPLEDRIVRDLPDLLRRGDVMVFNDTRVMPAELHGIRVRGEARAAVAFTLAKREAANTWRAFARPGKRLKIGDRVIFGEGGNACLLGEIWAAVAEKTDDGQVLLAFDIAGPDLDMAIHAIGTVPLPPYISSKRRTDDKDRIDYQTVYAREEGAVAAPTAGLHFTPELLDRLDRRGVQRLFATLHVGAGTFLPIKVEDTREHLMHAEWGTIPVAVADSLNATRAAGGRIVAVGTTSLRLLETAVDEAGRFAPYSGETDIFITPGRPIRSADVLMTNFHLPRSTLFMLVSAFSGIDCMKRAYDHAIRHGYRFYSYGDGSLLFKAAP